MPKNVNDLNGALDKETREVMERQVEKSISSPEQINRVMINFLGEMLESLKKLEREVSTLNRAVILANKDPILKSLGKKP